MLIVEMINHHLAIDAGAFFFECLRHAQDAGGIGPHDVETVARVQMHLVGSTRVLCPTTT